jgi:SAM-dependent methyltransferase
MLHCIDASEGALRVASTNLVDNGNCRFHLATLDKMPFPDDAMDFGYSLGVLHHIPDTLGALRDCVRKLKVGAPFLLYLYYAFDNRPPWFRMIWRVSDAVRRLVSRAPFRIKSLFCDICALTVYWPLARTARLAVALGVRTDNFPLSAYKNQSVYVMRTDALDRLGTRLEKRFTRDEVRRMMTDAGLSAIEFHEGMPHWVAVGRRQR